MIARTDRTEQPGPPPRDPGNPLPSRGVRPPAPAERELAQILAAQTDLNQFAPLYEAYVDLVWRYAMSRLGDAERAADATSSIFQRVLSALPAFHPQRRGETTSFRAWLMTIAHNVVLTEQLRRQPGISLDDPAATHRLVDARRGTEDQAIAATEGHRVLQALTQLPATQRQIVELRLLGLKGGEIAAQLGMRESAVKTAHHRAHARLRELLGEPDESWRPSR